MSEKRLTRCFDDSWMSSLSSEKGIKISQLNIACEVIEHTVKYACKKWQI